MKLQGKSIVVTGASAGMGKAIATLFVQEGANVIAVARRKERLDEMAQALKDCPGTFVPYPADITKQEQIEGALEQAVKEFGQLDVVVNNAGIMDGMEPIGEITNERLAQVMDVNFTAVLYSMRKAVNIFLDQGKGGNIICVTSVGAFRVTSGAAYCASKAAAAALVKNTAYMYMEEGIRCNAIAPGAISTEISSSMGRPNMKGYGRTKLIRATGPEAIGEAMDIAQAALYLASDESKYVNGATLTVDGGTCAG